MLYPLYLGFSLATESDGLCYHSDRMFMTHKCLVWNPLTEYYDLDNCQAQVQSPKVQIPVKGLGVTKKSHGPPTPPHPPITFNHEGVL